MIAEKDFAGRQTRGSRGHQEDAYAFSDIVTTNNGIEGLLAVVADGMGGHTSGEQASELALESFVEAFHQSTGSLRERFKTAVTRANEAISDEMKRTPELEGMGTTFLALGLTRSGVEWISVGDSPLFLWRDNIVKRLNEDHSFRPVLHEMLATGELTPAAAAKHPFRNLLRAALTGGEIEMIDQPSEPFAVREGDVIIAATDGIQTLSDEAIGTALGKIDKNANAAVIASTLLQAVLEVKNPKQDNTTIAILKIGPKGFVAEATATAPMAKTKDETETIIMNPLLRKGAGK